MNAKEDIIQILRLELQGCNMRCDLDEYEKIKNLITAVENAIFDVPSEEEMDKIIKDYIIELVDCKSIKKHEQSFIYAICFQAINFIINYKKPESDGK